MTKAEMVESVLLRLSGGRLSADTDVRREDIFILIDAQIQDVLSDFSDKQVRKDSMHLRIVGSPGEDISLQFAKTYTLIPIKDSDRDMYYIQLPGKPYQSGDVTAIHSIGPKQSPGKYIPAQSGSYLAGLDCMGIVFYWYEQVNDDHRVYLKDIAKPCELLVRLSLDPGSAGDNTDLNLPKGMEMEVIKRLLKHFSIDHPADVELTDTDETRAGK